MPYITVDDRVIVREEGPFTAGQLNFILTEICLEYIKRKGLSYQTINDVAGVLALMPGEMARRFVWAYEDLKIHQNGDLQGFVELRKQIF